MSAACEPHQVDQILSLVNDQRECVTLRSIMLELTVNRGAARSILEEVVRRCDEGGEEEGAGGTQKYEVVRMVSRGSGGGRMELVVSDENTRREGRPFSIAPSIPSDDPMEVDEDDVDDNGDPVERDSSGENASTSPVLDRLTAAHERALATQRDKLLDGNEGELFEIFNDMSILPAPELCEEDDEGRLVVRRVERGRDVMALPSAAPSGGRSNKPKFGKTSPPAAAPTAIGKGKKGKPTTAAAFFGSQTVKKKSKKTAAPAEQQSKQEKPPAKSSSKKAEAPDSPTDKENKDNEKPSSEGRPEKKKRTSGSKKAAEVPPTTSGNADDFTGDVDEDDDFLAAEKERKARVAKEARRRARSQMNDEATKKRNKGGLEGRRSKVAPEKRRQREEEAEEDDARKERAREEECSDGEENEYDDVVLVEGDKKKKKKKKEAKKQSGAMDAFAKKKDAPAPSASTKNVAGGGGGSKKRRKRLVEETTVDENGYMVTQNVTVWEEVSEDDEAPSKPAPAAKSAIKSGAKSSMAGKSNARSGKGGVGGKKKQAGLMGFFAKKK